MEVMLKRPCQNLKEATVKCAHKNIAPTLFLMLVAGVLLVYGTPGMSAAQTDAAEPSASEAASIAELLDQMADKEYALYEKTEQIALQARLVIYQKAMQLRLDHALGDKPVITSLCRQIADLYGQLLMLRVEAILEIKRRWPEVSIIDLVDMMQYRPELLLSIMDDTDEMITIPGLDLSWDQKKAVSTTWLHREIQRMENEHNINLILLDLKSALTTQQPELAWAVDQIAAIVALQNERFDYRTQNFKETWNLLSPSQREKYVHLVKVGIRAQ
jgi:hypothetical protein